MHKLIEELKKTNPAYFVETVWEEDNDYVWDGEGDDPVNEDFIPYIVKVEVSTIINGEMISGVNYLADCYTKYGEKHCEDVHGYFPQMLDEAITELENQLN